MKHILLALAATAISVLMYGYDFGTNGQQVQVIPMIWKYQDASLYPGDSYMDTAAKYPSIFWRSIAFIGKYVDTEKLCFAIFLLTQCALYLSLMKLAGAIFGDRFSGAGPLWLSVLALLSPHLHTNSIVSRSPVMPPHLSHTTAAWCFAVWSLTMCFKDRHAWSLAMAAIAFVINPVVGAGVTVLLAVCSIVESKNKLCWLVLLTVVASALCVAIGLRNVADNVLIQLLYTWWPYHYFSSSWKASDWCDIFLFALAAILLLQTLKMDEKPVNKLKAILQGVGILFLIGFLAEKIPAISLLVFQFYRSDSFLLILTLIMAAVFIRERTENTPQEYLLGAVFAWALTRWWGDNGRAMSYVDYFFLISILFVYVLGRVKETWWSQTNFKRIAAVCLLSWLFFIPLKTINYRYKTKIYLSNKTSLDSAWIAAQKWALGNTPKDAMFLTPIDGGFRVFSKRPVWVEWPDMAATHWCKGYELTWLSKLKNIGFTEESLYAYGKMLHGKDNETTFHVNLYEKLNEKRFVPVIRYAVVYNKQRLGYPLRYQNAYFSIYEIGK